MFPIPHNQKPNKSQSEPHKKKKKKITPPKKGGLTYEINHETTIGAAAGGLSKVGHAIGVLGSGKEVRGAILNQISGVDQRVSKVEDGGVSLVLLGG